MLNDDCLGRTLDWLYAHDPTRLCAGIASQARQVFGISARQVHVDTTSFSASGAYSSAGERVQEPGKAAEALEAETALIAITYGYSRDQREERTAVDDRGFPPPMMGMLRCSYNPSMATASTKSVCSRRSWPSRSNCKRRMQHQACMLLITAGQPC